jgi:hypothetical protein
MTDFIHREGQLCCEEVPLADLAARHGTPLYVYSKAALLRHFRDFDRAFAGRPHLVCFAMKANDHLAILRLLAREGAGFDVVSGGELWKALRAGADPKKIVFSGVGKTEAELEYALRQGILMLNVESPAELEEVERVAARLGVRAPIALRVNPDVDPRTHPYISTGLQQSKFGIPIEDAPGALRRARELPHVDVVASTATSARSSPRSPPSSTRSRVSGGSSRAWPRRGSAAGSSTWTSGAGSASATRTRHRPRRRSTRPRWPRGSPACRSPCSSSPGASSSATPARW